MIGALRGKIIERRGSTLVIETGGVGYEVTATASVLSGQTDQNAECRLSIFTDVKENAINLFGFHSSLEREVFLLLRKVKGIGSKVAISILSGIGTEGVLTAIAQNDVTRLKQVPGIGGKTAERIMVELKEYVHQFAQEVAVESFPPIHAVGSPSSAGAEGDVILALEKLGFPLERARQVVKVTVSKFPERQTELRANPGELLRLALGNIGN